MPATPYRSVVEGLVNLASFTSLVVVVAGFLTGETPLIALGLVVGVNGVVWPWVAAGRRWAPRDAVVLTLGILVADLAALVVMWFATP